MLRNLEIVNDLNSFDRFGRVRCQDVFIAFRIYEGQWVGSPFERYDLLSEEFRECLRDKINERLHERSSSKV